MSAVLSIDPRTGASHGPVADESGPDLVDETVGEAFRAFQALQDAGRSGRARLLGAWADALEEHREEIVRIADRETALGDVRLGGELTRSIFQVRFLAGVVTEGGYLEATLDPPGDTPMGPRPDLRRMLVPLGPVAVFGASNFPLAFSVVGGDTASAVAAGCPVVVKVHDSHPATSVLCAGILRRSARQAELPDAVISLVFGRQAGVDLVRHPLVTAVSFTGSLTGGRALLQAINERPDPVPFFGELSGINPLVITPAAAGARGPAIAEGLTASFTASGGQFCTKPGLAFVPAGEAGDRLVEIVATSLSAASPYVLLNENIAASYRRGIDELTSDDAVGTVATGTGSGGDGFGVRARVLTIDAADLRPRDVEECFGPVVLLVRYRDGDDLPSLIGELPASLTGTIHAEEADRDLVVRLEAALRMKSGRVLFDGYPTGVAVSWAQHHGGPWPSTNSQHTSVGATAVRRFLRPVAWQNAPEFVLPAELRDGFDEIPRRVDGELRTPSTP
ncbi:aldehyde dehydrogenase (NADP(+)) [Streptosporangium sp. DT93]|uniref:aldehyde dehydrogenase (NADP(+)) n=1 Tax=Streptosporangium sp. DT93 TaxID=3393428 RepID=UPI003CE6CF11